MAGPAKTSFNSRQSLGVILLAALGLRLIVLAMTTNSDIAFCQLVPWEFEANKQSNLKRTYRRTSFTVTRLLSNFGVASTSPVLARFHMPVDASKSERRWLEGLYLDQPEEWDDPYRLFRW